MTTLQKKPMSRDAKLTLAAAVVGLILLFIFDSMFDRFTMQIFKLCAINIILALSLNLINGFTGLFSLGHAGFMAVGAYTCALLSMTPDQRPTTSSCNRLLPGCMTCTCPSCRRC